MVSPGLNPQKSLDKITASGYSETRRQVYIQYTLDALDTLDLSNNSETLLINDVKYEDYLKFVTSFPLYQNTFIDTHRYH